MNAEEAIYPMLQDSAALTTEVGDRIYPITFPQDQPAPAIIYSQLEEVEQASKTGPVSDGWVFQVTTIAQSNIQAVAISRIVKSLLNWQTKDITGGTIRTRFSDEISANWENEQQYFQIVQEYRARKAN